MKLPEYFDVRYDPTTLKYTCNFSVDRYNKYLLRRVTDELAIIAEDAEMKTGLQLLHKMWKIVVPEDDRPFYIKDDYPLSLYEYRTCWNGFFDISFFAKDDMECFWTVISRYCPFSNADIEQYLKYLNVKELEKNMFICLSDDQWNMIKCYEELNK
jgi:hypothetical protein